MAVPDGPQPQHLPDGHHSQYMSTQCILPDADLHAPPRWASISYGIHLICHTFTPSKPLPCPSRHESSSFLTQIHTIVLHDTMHTPTAAFMLCYTDNAICNANISYKCLNALLCNPNQPTMQLPNQSARIIDQFDSSYSASQQSIYVQ